ncbi:hypothetical protein CCM_04559 [Cordyceps militaris CM01]|uniref:Myb-like domain-containing protein n=1 Tax=Cordyceps militaris (strain CM01) TaxID=983644 RepID=G3JFV3_CORMM|nr:uncharacterized protein CCM_04559 [Cordyceps militaris CM01]EGX93187.1 hypothetical protein CCM_04559 [Cordyceps militaris CM01]
MANEEKMVLTDGEMRILKAIFANLNSKPDVDWDTAAVDASLGNAKSIKERYRQMCVRLGWNKPRPSGGGSAPVTPIKTKKTASPCKVVKRSGGGRKRKQPEEEEEEEAEEEE